MLCRSIGNEGDCLGDGLPGPTVFQAGSNSQYIVFARHPPQADWAPDRSVTEYYYITRQEDERDALKPVSLVGPLDETEYLQEKRRLRLPEFSRVFESLK